MNLEKLIKEITGRKHVCYIGQGHYRISKSQAEKLTGGFLPKNGYMRCMRINENRVLPAFTVNETEYYVQKCTHESKQVWCIYN